MSSGTLLPICFRCEHFRSVAIGKGWVCKAYPDGIPSAILASQHDHRLPFEGDHGITFEPKPAEDEWNEEDHPRGGNPENPGQFSSGGGGKGKAKASAVSNEELEASKTIIRQLQSKIKSLTTPPSSPEERQVYANTVKQRLNEATEAQNLLDAELKKLPKKEQLAITAESATVYHGTSSEFLQSIKEKGLIVKKDSRNYDPSLYKGSRGESIYVTKSVEDAANWALFGGAGDNSVVLEIEIPDDRKLKSDKEASSLFGYTNFLHSGKIPPEWIKSVRKVKPNPTAKNPELEDPEAFDSRNPIFAVVYCKEGAEDYDPNHPENPLTAFMASDSYKKFEKKAAHYVSESPDPAKACGGCYFFTSPNSCSLVAGYINPEGKCIHWMTSPQAADSWNEGDHPRDEDGKFSSSGSSGGKHHELISGIGFKKDSSDPNKFNGPFIDKANLTQLDSFLKVHDFQALSHSNVWINRNDGTRIEVSQNDPDKGSVIKMTSPVGAADAEFNENDHPRDEDGKFATSGSGGGSAEKLRGKVKVISPGSVTKESIKNGPESLVKKTYSWIKHNQAELKNDPEFESFVRNCPKVSGTFFRGLTVPKGTKFTEGQIVDIDSLTSATPFAKKAQQFVQWSRHETHYAGRPKETDNFYNSDSVLFVFEDSSGNSLKPLEEFVASNSRFGGGFKGEAEIVPDKGKYQISGISQAKLPAFAKYQEEAPLRIIKLKPVMRAQDEKKFDKPDVQYEAHASEPAHQCQKCDHFIEPNSCEVVNGTINAEGWCEKWTKVAHDMQIATDPPVSEAQRRAMWAAKAGHSTLGIPQSVGKEFAEADPGGKLPPTAKDMTRNGWRKIFAGLAEMARFFGEEEQEPEHEEGGEDSAGSLAPTPGIGGTRDAAPKGRAASVAFVTKDGRTLLVKRASDEKNFPGHWAFPGGQVEEDEDFETAAKRECGEEIGDKCSFDSMKVLDQKRTKFGWDHVTYVVPVDKPFEPDLNHEHEDYAWADCANLPEPMHPAVRDSIEAAMKPKTNPKDLQGADEKIILEVDDQDGEIQKLLKHIQHAAGVGHSFHVVVDPEDKEYQKKFYIDGDGNCKIRDIKLAADHMMALDWARTAQLEKAVNGRVSLAFDFESVREKDKDGRMKISSANISKANVCPYYGKEIPDFEMLGLDPERKYMLLRDPEELKKAAPTFNNLPILSTHVPVTSTAFPQDKVVGSTGSDCSFDGTYLKNSLGFWPQEAIDGIESNNKKQLSAGYRYRADMKPGEYKGVKYDGVMRDIEGNHLALVTEGRAGADVVVGDSQIRNFNRSTKVMSKLSTKSAQAVVAALKRRGLLALDANPEEAAELVGKLEGLEEEEGHDEFDPNSGLPSYMKEEKDEDAEDEYESTQEKDLDETMDRRAADARARLGRDETVEEREKREEEESAKDARDRLGRDETMEECQDRRARDRRARDYRAARDAHRSARDRLLHASDTTKKHYGDMRRAEDSYRRAMDAANQAKDANRADDARRAADAMADAEDRRSKAEDAWKHARDAMKSCYDSILTARDARKRARDARRMGKDSTENEPMTRGEVEDALRASDRQHASAMDAAIQKERARAAGFNDAMRIVRPLVGELALDSAASADDVYRTSLKILGVKTDGIHPSAYPEMYKLAAQRKADSTSSRSRYAQDSANSDSVPKVTDLVPGISRIRAI